MEQSAATRSESARTGTTREEWRNTILAGLANYIDAGSIVADPKFTDPENFDFTLPPDSPALKLGFKPIDTTKIGAQAYPQRKTCLHVEYQR